MAFAVSRMRQIETEQTAIRNKMQSGELDDQQIELCWCEIEDLDDELKQIQALIDDHAEETNYAADDRRDTVMRKGT